MIQWLPELKVWESFSNISETNPVTWICRWDVQDMSRHVVGFEALEVLATHDMGPVCHSMSQYEVVLCQCCANVASSVWDAETEPRLHGQRDLRTLHMPHMMKMNFKFHRESSLTWQWRMPCVLIPQCWKGWCIGPIERMACEIFSLTLDFMSSWPIMNSNIFLGNRACSGSASASLLKETGEF